MNPSLCEDTPHAQAPRGSLRTYHFLPSFSSFVLVSQHVTEQASAQGGGGAFGSSDHHGYRQTDQPDSDTPPRSTLHVSGFENDENA